MQSLFTAVKTISDVFLLSTQDLSLWRGQCFVHLGRVAGLRLISHVMFADSQKSLCVHVCVVIQPAGDFGFARRLTRLWACVNNLLFHTSSSPILSTLCSLLYMLSWQVGQAQKLQATSVFLRDMWALWRDVSSAVNQQEPCREGGGEAEMHDPHPT